MGKFLESEKLRQIVFKQFSKTISKAGQEDGIFRGKPYPFCLPRHLSDETLFPAIRETAVAYFRDYGIKWHQGIDGKPSNHLCDSMVCGVNFLYPFARQPEALAELLKPFFPEIKKMLPMEGEHYVAYEWIGAQNYLGERAPESGNHTRGANFTSADAAVRFQREDGSIQVVLVEWKYTESYSSTSYLIAKSGTDRSQIYRPLLDLEDCIIDKSKVGEWDNLFYEPFYQFMRQQLLAHEMEKDRELGAGTVSLLHISPRKNTDFYKVTSPAFRGLGKNATDVWKKLLREPDRFLSVYTDELFADFEHPAMRDWKAYIEERYPSLMEREA